MISVTLVEIKGWSFVCLEKRPSIDVIPTSINIINLFFYPLDPHKFFVFFTMVLPMRQKNTFFWDSLIRLGSKYNGL